MKKLLVILFFTGVLGLIVMFLIQNTSHVVVGQEKNEEKVLVKLVPKEIKVEETIEEVENNVVVEEDEKEPMDIPEKVLPYLRDDTFELKEGMTLVEVDKIWGKPDKVEREGGSDGENKILWEYGDFWKRHSKLKGPYYYKVANFKNGKLSYWKKNAQIDFKTHTRDDAFNSHLDKGSPLTKNMTKEEVYRIMGLPYYVEVVSYNNREFETKWTYFEGNDIYHVSWFENNRLVSWKDY